MKQLNSPDNILSAARRVVRTAESRDPERIAESLGIHVMEAPFRRQKGAYKVIKGQRYIFLKEDLTEPMRSIVLLHEIGHDQLHRYRAEIFQEFTLFDMAGSVMEFEANLFAAHIMLPDDDVLRYIEEGFDAAKIAAVLGSDINLVALKVSDLSRRGHAFRVPEHKRNFLK